MNACHKCVGLSSLPAFYRFSHLNMFLSEQLCLCIDHSEFTLVRFCNILLYKIVLLCDERSIKYTYEKCILEVAVQDVIDLQE